MNSIWYLSQRDKAQEENETMYADKEFEEQLTKTVKKVLVDSLNWIVVSRARYSNIIQQKYFHIG